MMTQTTAYDHPTDNALIDCVEQGGFEKYPVLHIGATVIWPTREQLVAIRDVIQGYLNMHPAPEEVEKIAAGTEAEDRAEAQTVREFTDAEVQEMF